MQNEMRDWLVRRLNDFGTVKVEALADYLLANGVIVPPETGIGDVSDGYHTFNELYHHRAVLFSVICNTFKDKAWKSRKHDTDDMYDGMFIVGIETPQGQATYHYDIDPYWDMFEVKELPNAPKWDGHTPEEAIRRISMLQTDNVIVPPCKVGDIIYQNVLVKDGTGFCVERQVVGFHLGDFPKLKGIKRKQYFIVWHKTTNSLTHIDFNEIGKTIFFNREESKKALAEWRKTNER